MKESNQVFVRQKKQLHKKKLKVTIALSGLVVLAMVVVTTMLGEAAIGFGEVLSVVTGKVFGNTDMLTDLSGGLIAIVWDIRLPRILTGIFFVGAGLAMSGTVFFQALLMNPLADPYTIGISTGAALGATIAIFVSAIIQVASVAILPAAFVGAMITLLLVLKIAGNSKTLSSSSLIVAGIIVSSIGSAAISLLKSLSGDEVSLIVFWLMGSLASRTWQHVWVIAPVIIIGLIVFRHYGQELNLLCTGEVNARNYGVNVSRVRMILLITASLVTAACVSVSGIIGFVGLVIPIF